MRKREKMKPNKIFSNFDHNLRNTIEIQLPSNQSIRSCKISKVQLLMKKTLMMNLLMTKIMMPVKRMKNLTIISIHYHSIP